MARDEGQVIVAVGLARVLEIDMDVIVRDAPGLRPHVVRRRVDLARSRK